MNQNEKERDRTDYFLSIIKESGVNWAIKITEQIENGDDLRSSKSFLSNNIPSEFDKVTFSIQKTNAKHLQRLISHNENYFQPITSSNKNSNNENKICDDLLLHLPTQCFDDKKIYPLKYSKFLSSDD